MEERIQKLETLLLQDPNDPFLLHALALEFVKLGEEVRAEEYFKQVLSANPEYVGSYYHLGKLFERTGRDQAALDTYKKGMEIASGVKDVRAFHELEAAYEDLI